MKHHFADLLDREGDYWSIVPNRDRWAYHYDDLRTASDDIDALTVSKDDLHWERLFEFDKLQELTLDSPSKKQLESLSRMPKVHRLRISHARPKTLDFLREQSEIRELVLEYLSGVDDLEVLASLPKLKSLHLENLRRVKDFSGLRGSASLKYLSIHGTLDWNQPIEGLDFVAGLQNLEHLKLAWIRVSGEPPLLSPIKHLDKLKEIDIAMNAFPLEDFAFLEANCPHVKGAVRPAFFVTDAKRCQVTPPDYRATMPEEEFKAFRGAVVLDGKRFMDEPTTAYLLGKGTRTLSGKAETVLKKCSEHEAHYRELVAKLGI